MSLPLCSAPTVAFVPARSRRSAPPRPTSDPTPSEAPTRALRPADRGAAASKDGLRGRRRALVLAAVITVSVGLGATVTAWVDSPDAAGTVTSSSDTGAARDPLVHVGSVTVAPRGGHDATPHHTKTSRSSRRHAR